MVIAMHTPQTQGPAVTPDDMPTPPQPGSFEDPGRDILQPLFDDPSRTGAWQDGYFGLHGYLFAVATHPKLIPPSTWLPPLFGGLEEEEHGFADEEAFSAACQAVFELYNLVNEQVLATEPALPRDCVIQPHAEDNLAPGAPLRQWAQGFARAREWFGHHMDDWAAESETDAAHAAQLVTVMIEAIADPDSVRAKAAAVPGEALDCDQLIADAVLYFGFNLKLLAGLRDGPPPEDGASPDTVREAGEVADMPPDRLLAVLEDPAASYQWAAMDEAVRQREAITPLLLERLDSVIADPQREVDHPTPGLMYALVLLGHFREQRAHEPLLRLAALPAATVDYLLGDAITELLPVWLWQTSGGEQSGLKRLLEDREASGYCRGGAAEALAFGALYGFFEREPIEDDLVALLQDSASAMPGNPVLNSVYMALITLYPDRHTPFLREWLRSGVSDIWPAEEGELDELLETPRDRWLADSRTAVDQRFPETVHGYMSHWAGFQPGFRDEGGRFGGPPRGGSARSARKATKPKGPPGEKKKHKRRQQKQARKRNRKGKGK